jgi:pseudouridine-5'-phosphate glycosidase
MDAIRWAPETERARLAGTPIVGLETSVLAQGLPSPVNAEAARRMTAAVTGTGACPAFTAIVQGVPAIGLTNDELERFLAREGVAKASTRDLPVAMQRGTDAATTVAAALVLCHSAGVQVFATGGIGGVHLDAPFDESADLLELSRRPVVAVCAGPKSLLDLPATAERLETHGITVVGYRTAELPGFLYAGTGIPLSATVDDVGAIADIFVRQRALALPGALLVVQNPPAEYALPRRVVDEALQVAREEASRGRVHGSALTPFLLTALARLTDGRTLEVNVALLGANARLAGEIAGALAGIGKSGIGKSGIGKSGIGK